MRAMLIALLLALGVADAAAQTSYREGANAAARTYWPLKEARINAYKTRDRAFFERLLTDNFVTLAPNGAIMGRRAYLDAEFGGGEADNVTRDTEVRNFDAVRTGDVVVLTYEEFGRHGVGEQVFTEHLQRLDVYVRERGRWRLQSMTAVRPPEAPAVIAMSETQLAVYAGTYEFGPGIVSTVAREGDHLIEQTTGNPPGPLLPVGPDTFYAPSDLEGRVVFTRDANGHVDAQLYRSGSQEVRGRRTD